MDKDRVRNSAYAIFIGPAIGIMIWLGIVYAALEFVDWLYK